MLQHGPDRVMTKRKKAMEGKSFRKQLSRAIRSFQSCQNKDSISLPTSTVSINCGCSSRRASRKVDSQSKPEDTVSLPRQKIDFNVDRDDYTCTDGLTDADSIHSVASSSDDEIFTMILHGKKQSMKSKRKKKKRGVACNRRTLQPSCSSSRRNGWFSSGEYSEESMNMSCLISSSSTSDSAKLAVTKINMNNKKKKLRSSGMCKGPVVRLLPWKVAGRVVRESMAVVKRSENPYQDFRRSMVEMIREKRLEEEAGELEQFLRCFLSLNYRAHHPVILRVFSDIWDFLFPLPPTPGSSPVDCFLLFISSIFTSISYCQLS